MTLLITKLLKMERLWDSGKVKEFTSEEHNAFQNFCKEWAKHPGSLACWNRVEDK